MSSQRSRRRQAVRGVAVRLPDVPPPVTVVASDDAEQAEYVVCVTDDAPSYFTDDVHTTCWFCEQPIRHRPHAPQHARKICPECAVELTEEAA